MLRHRYDALELGAILYDLGWIYSPSTAKKSLSKSNAKEIRYDDILNPGCSPRIALCEQCTVYFEIFWNEFIGAGGRGYYPGPLMGKAILLPTEGNIEMTPDYMAVKRPMQPIFGGSPSYCSNCKMLSHLSTAFLSDSKQFRKVQYIDFPYFGLGKKNKSMLCFNEFESINSIQTRMHSFEFKIKKGRVIASIFNKANFKGVMNFMTDLEYRNAEYDMLMRKIRDITYGYIWNMNYPRSFEIKREGVFFEKFLSVYESGYPQSNQAILDHVMNTFDSLVNTKERWRATRNRFRLFEKIKKLLEKREEQ